LFKNYYALTKPGIVYGNLLTAAAGYLFASRWHINLGVYAATLAGTALVIASAGVFNNFIDRGIDKKMARTQKRALVTKIISGQNAIIYATALGVAGFIILALFTNWLVVILGAIAIFFYVVLYGFVKRRSVHGTLVGTIPGAIPPVAGYAAAVNHLDGGAFIIFLIMVCWQMPHFYSIAIFRLNDYKAANIPVLPVKKGIRRAKLEILLYTFAFVGAVTALSAFGYTGLVFLLVMGSLGLYWLWRGLQGFKTTNDTRWARQMFGLSLIIVLVFSLMLSVGRVLP